MTEDFNKIKLPALCAHTLTPGQKENEFSSRKYLIVVAYQSSTFLQNIDTGDGDLVSVVRSRNKSPKCAVFFHWKRVGRLKFVHWNRNRKGCWSTFLNVGASFIDIFVLKVPLWLVYSTKITFIGFWTEWGATGPICWTMEIGASCRTGTGTH